MALRPPVRCSRRQQRFTPCPAQIAVALYRARINATTIQAVQLSHCQRVAVACSSPRKPHAHLQDGDQHKPTCVQFNNSIPFQTARPRRVQLPLVAWTWQLHRSRVSTYAPSIAGKSSAPASPIIRSDSNAAIGATIKRNCSINTAATADSASCAAASG
eukprot:CAMPEP_0119317400 /NCGR_PEP_ID=MMETSP1333-20130426/43041_1 /TAXON_ID=418940 /ORGANISM="Scyphosphaera apsteinii, Strain RCC1455" /LENGTH=158 /DNA_ID=CAMNT_0007323321 /DNA_START=196 /DNA_END=669 /DNA_ORIENTATION=-